MTTIDERLLSIENDLNRLMESILSAIEIDEASDYVEIHDDKAEELLYRINSIENRINSLKYKWKQVYRNKNK